MFFGIIISLWSSAVVSKTVWTRHVNRVYIYSYKSGMLYLRQRTTQPDLFVRWLLVNYIGTFTRRQLHCQDTRLRAGIQSRIVSLPLQQGEGMFIGISPSIQCRNRPLPFLPAMLPDLLLSGPSFRLLFHDTVACPDHCRVFNGIDSTHEAKYGSDLASLANLRKG